MELKILIKNSEERFISYKKLLEELNKNKNIFIVDDKFVIWYKNFVRDCKNDEQIWLKKLIKEKTHENEGLNPISCYKY